MVSGDWEEIQGFVSQGEFDRLKAWISEAIAEGVLTEVPVAANYGGSPMFDEHWYRTSDGQLWRLVAPEAPFRGAFERVDADTL